jgi:putative two-component system response regulator
MTAQAAPHLHSEPEYQTVLVCDDAADSVGLISGLLADRYQVKVATSGEDCLQTARKSPAPDLILLDILLPGIDGIDVCRQLKSDAATAHIPVIFLTGKSEDADEALGLQVGGADYITKPVNAAILMARVASQLQLKASRDFLRSKADFLETEVARRTAEMEAAQDAAILALSMLAETRDADTGNHIRRTQHYVKALALHLREHPKFTGQFDDRTVAMLFKSAPLHDIGKVGIPDRILLKPGRLDAEEFSIMKTHTTIGYEALAQAERVLGVPLEHLRFAKEIAHSHQEKWDGSGYPQGLKGDDIPVSARLMALADVYDALISTRVYKTGVSHTQAVQMIFQGRGQHFDPDMVDAFIEIQDEFAAIALRFADDELQLQRKMEFMAQAIADDASLG